MGRSRRGRRDGKGERGWKTGEGLEKEGEKVEKKERGWKRPEGEKAGEGLEKRKG